MPSAAALNPLKIKEIFWVAERQGNRRGALLPVTRQNLPPFTWR
jgi:hypothetical protein